MLLASFVFISNHPAIALHHMPTYARCGVSAHIEKAAYVREWLVKAGLGEEADNLDILFYPARYHSDFGSIFPMGDLTAQVGDTQVEKWLGGGGGVFT